MDLRLAFASHFYKEGSEEPDETFDRFFKVFGEEIENFKASEEGKDFWGARMIWTGIRALDQRKIIEDMDACISIKVRIFALPTFPVLPCRTRLLTRRYLDEVSSPCQWL